jgi:tetratricopeptide (TPR) repeat protein
MNIFQDGVRLFKEGKYIEAVEKLHTVASAEQKNHKAWNALGVALSKTGDLDQAIICFENAITINPDNQTYKKNLERARAKRFLINLPLPTEKTSSFTDTSSISDDKVIAFNSSSDSLIHPIISPELNKSGSLVTSRTISLNPPANTTQEEGIFTGKKENIFSPEITNYYDKAQSLFGQGSYYELSDLIVEAHDIVNKALDISPDFFDAWQLKISILSALGKENPEHYIQALAACDHALAIQPDNALIWFNKAGILENLSRFDEAVSAYEQAYIHSSQEPLRLGIILMRKGAALEKVGRESQALQTYEQVCVTDRFFGDAMDKKGEFIGKMGNRDSSVAAYRTAGTTHLKYNQFDKAVQSFNNILMLNSDDEGSLYNKGQAYLGLYEQNHNKEDLTEALSAFDAALRIQPQNMTYLIQKGRTLLDLGRFEEGLQSLDRALWINPSDGITLMNKGTALYQLSRHEEALKYFELVCAQYTQQSGPWLMRSKIHLDWKQYDIALEEIEKAIQISPDEKRLYEQKVIILRALGREEEARNIDIYISSL